jgi:glycosyltransferase involved in cell wall biosynthesis
MSFLAPAFGTVCRFLNKKTRVIALVHNAIPHEKRFFDKSFARYFFKRCFAFIVMSDTVKNDLLNLIPRAKIIQLHHPIYQQYKPRYDRQTACQNLNIEAEKRNILFFGLIRRYKGLDILIDAFGKLNSSNYQLLVAGECYGDFQPYREQIDALPNRENVKVWEEYIPDDMVTTLFSAADLLVLPYREATQSGVTALAIQLETPMIGTNAGSLGEYIQRSGTGMAVEKNSADALAQAIAEFFRGDKRAEYAQNLKKEKELLSWDSFGEKLQNFLEESLPHSADEN